MATMQATEPTRVQHADFRAASKMSGLTKAAQFIGMVVAMVSVFGALAVGPLIMSVVALPGYWIGGRPLGVALTSWNKRLHPALVDCFYRFWGTKFLVYGHMPGVPPALRPIPFAARGIMPKQIMQPIAMRPGC